MTRDDHLDATVHALRQVGAATAATRGRMADAVELRRRAAPIAAMYRARRIAVYSPADTEALRAFTELVEGLDAAEERT
jgi:hypothetical protein